MFSKTGPGNAPAKTAIMETKINQIERLCK
jgi:hypothetical protein